LKQARFNLENEKLGLIDAQSKLSSVIYEEDAYLKNFTMQLLEVSDRIADMTKQKQTMLLRNEKYSYIISPYDGIIQEVLARKDNPVEVGEKLFTINPLNVSTKELEISFFIPFNNQEQAAEGMDIVVAPFNVDKNRYGQIKGRLSQINSYPSTNEFIAKTTDNDDFVKMVTVKGPVYFAKGKLLTDSATISGLKWTSFKGTPYRINPGIICDVNIYVDYIRPISFVIPWIKKTLRDEKNQ
jgi:HlyD family secretion protein